MPSQQQLTHETFSHCKGRSWLPDTTGASRDEDETRHPRGDLADQPKEGVKRTGLPPCYALLNEQCTASVLCID